jgi:hypothetical protein
MLIGQKQTKLAATPVCATRRSQTSQIENLKYCRVVDARER